VTRFDWIIVGFAAFTALMGCRRGFVRSACSLAGLALGAVLGARAAPQFLAGGAHSRYTALIGLAGAVAGALVFQTAAGIVGGILRSSLRLAPPLGALDSAAGLVLGAAWGLALAWVVGAVAVQVPGHADWRRQAHDSQVLHRLNEVAPPRDLLRLRPSLPELPV
jgi:uncharacterized membrane protein required for colicin V production